MAETHHGTEKTKGGSVHVSFVRQRPTVRVFLLVGPLAALGLAILAEVSSVAGVTVYGVGAANVARSLSEGLLAGSLIGIFVDLVMKRELGEEIAEKTSKATAAVFFNDMLGGGRGLPVEYFEGMRRLAANDVMSLSLSWRLDFQWGNSGELLVTGSSVNTLINTGTSDWPLISVWILALSPERPRPKLEAYEVDCVIPSPDGSKSPSVFRRALGQGDLEKIASYDHWGATAHLSEIEGMSVPPGATATVRFRGTTFAEGFGMLPLVVRYPVLSQRLVLGGPALADLELSVSAGRGSVVLSPEGSTLVGEAGFGVEGTTIRVAWSARTSMTARTDQAGISVDITAPSSLPTSPGA